MQHRIDRCLAHRHCNVRHGIFVEPGTSGDVFSRLLQLIYTLQ